MFIKNHNKKATVWNNNPISYSTVINNVNNIVTLIDNIPAEKIAIYSENRPEWIYTFFAGWRKDTTVVPIDHLSTADEVAYIINDCRPEILFISKEKKEVINEALAQIDYDFKVMIFEDLPEESPG